MIYYSNTTKGFYTTEIHGTNIPSDCVEITEQYHQELLDSQSKGKEIKANKNGYPVAVDRIPPVPTWEQIRSRRDSLLKDSDWSVAGDATPKPSKEAWLSYRQALRNLPQKFSKPEEVVWPKITK